MQINSAEFVVSNTDVEKCPAPKLPEYAFIGRSNVGKSSLINMLTQRAKLAKTSSTPGKTQLINHFLINGLWYLVDLPGSGYAKTSKAVQSTFSVIIQDYIGSRSNLMNLFVLIDIRLEAQPNDLNFLGWLGTNEIPFVIIFTKSDKLGVTQIQSKLAAYRKKLLEEWAEMPQYFVTSAETRVGREDVLNFIAETNLRFNNPFSR